MAEIDAATLLRRTDLFGGIDEVAAKELASRLVTRTFKRGQPLFQQGDAGDGLFIIVEGSVAVVITGESGNRVVLTTLQPPDVLGEIALLDGGSRSAAAEALEPTTTLVLARAAFLQLVGDPAFTEQLLRSLGALVRRLSEQASDFVFLDLPGRVAKVLVRLADEMSGSAAARRQGMPVELAVTQGRLADMVGGSRQSVNQILQGFQTRGLLEIQGRRLLISGFAALRQRAGLDG